MVTLGSLEDDNKDFSMYEIDMSAFILNWLFEMAGNVRSMDSNIC